MSWVVLTYLKSTEENPSSVETWLGDVAVKVSVENGFTGEGMEEGGDDNESNEKEEKRRIEVENEREEQWRRGGEI